MGMKYLSYLVLHFQIRKKVVLILLTALLYPCTIFCQDSKTIEPFVESKNIEIDILAVAAFEEETVVLFSAESLFTKYITMNQRPWIKISPSTYIEANTPNGIVKLKAKHFFLGSGNSKVKASFNRKYYTQDFPLGSHLWYMLVFDAIPTDIDTISIKEEVFQGFKWMGISINPRTAIEFPKLEENQRSIDAIQELIKKTACPYRGIYEIIGEEATYQLALLENDNKIVLVYISEEEPINSWETGDIKAELRRTANTNTFKADWYADALKFKNTNCIISFDGVVMKVILDGEEVNYIKMTEGTVAPDNDTPNKTWSGSGFALNLGYIVTNYHVIENANKIIVRGVDGSLSKEYSAEVIAQDKTNDLALIRINDPTYSFEETVPYAIDYQMVDVGETVWVLGYPLTQILGNEIKLTNGIISSKSGYQGDVSSYQISAPVQPGNSGGPLFDSHGNIVGIVNAGIPGADNVGYAIKTSYLMNLIESYSLTSILPSKNNISSLSLKDQVKIVRDYVYLLICSSNSSNESNP